MKRQLSKLKKLFKEGQKYKGITVTVDFDGTLTKKKVQNYVKYLMEQGADVFVLTSRFCELTKNYYPKNPTNEELWKLTAALNIDPSKVIFTRMQEKAQILQLTSAAWHLDDDELELQGIDIYCHRTKGIDVNSEDWEEKCDTILEKLTNND